MTSMDSEEIKEHRNKIDSINHQLLDLLNVRAQSAHEIGLWKKRFKLPFYDPVREKHILDSLLAQNKGPLSNDAIRRIFQCIIDENRKLEETL